MKQKSSDKHVECTAQHLDLGTGSVGIERSVADIAGGNFQKLENIPGIPEIKHLVKAHLYRCEGEFHFTGVEALELWTARSAASARTARTNAF